MHLRRAGIHIIVRSGIIFWFRFSTRLTFVPSIVALKFREIWRIHYSIILSLDTRIGWWVSSWSKRISFYDFFLFKDTKFRFKVWTFKFTNIRTFSRINIYKNKYCNQTFKNARSSVWCQMQRTFFSFHRNTKAIRGFYHHSLKLDGQEKFALNLLFLKHNILIKFLKYRTWRLWRYWSYCLMFKVIKTSIFEESLAPSLVHLKLFSVFPVLVFSNAPFVPGRT